GATILFELRTVTGTENLMMAAALAEGRTVLENCAREPEVAALADALNAMGARILGAGSSVVTIDGVASLRPMDVQVIPDRIEAGTLLAAAMITGGDGVVLGARPEDLDGALAKLREAGARISAERGGLRIVAPERPGAVDFITAPFPGFPTDLQAQLMACLTVARGASRVVETVFENRFMHVQELVRMGADIAVDGHTAVVRGVARLSGAPVMATDLRASASLVLAGLRAEGKTKVHRVYHLDRGYESLEKKLEAMGGRANPEEDAGECPVDNVALLAVGSQHKRNPLVYETCESCGGIWLESADFAEEGDSAEELTKGIVEFYREFAVKPGTKA